MGKRARTAGRNSEIQGEYSGGEMGVQGANIWRILKQMRGGVEKHRFFAQDAEQDGHTVASLIWQLNAALSKERPLDRDGSRTLASHRLELCTNLTSCEIKLPKFSRCAGSTLRALRALRPGEIG